MSSRGKKLLMMALNDNSAEKGQKRIKRCDRKLNYRISSETEDKENCSTDSSFHPFSSSSEFSVNVSDQSMFEEIGELISETFVDIKTELSDKTDTSIGNHHIYQKVVKSEVNSLNLKKPPAEPSHDNDHTYTEIGSGINSLDLNKLLAEPSNRRMDSHDSDHTYTEIGSDLNKPPAEPRGMTMDCHDNNHTYTGSGINSLDFNKPSPDTTIVTFGKFVNNGNKCIESIGKRYWLKKTYCPYCFQEVTHFSRHLERKHDQEGAVKHLKTLKAGDPQRKILIDSMRKQGNYTASNTIDKIRPVKRPTENTNIQINLTDSDVQKSYVVCVNCMGYYKRNYLRRHRKRCTMISKNNRNISKRENHLSNVQLVTICNGVYKDFYDNLRLKQEIFPIMRNDERSQAAMNDVLICSYAESLLKKHKRVQIRTAVSNKMRELGRLLIFLKGTSGISQLKDALKPEFLDYIVAAVKAISGYNEETKEFEASSLAIHMGTTLKQVCDIATKLIIKKSRFFTCTNAEGELKDIKRLKGLLTSHWNSEISSLALKNLNQKKWEKPKLLPLTADIMIFQNFANSEAEKACKILKENQSTVADYRLLTECTVALTLLLNRKRIGEIQYLTVDAYCAEPTTDQTQLTELLNSLTKTEQLLAATFKRVVVGGKGSKPVAILFPRNLQRYISVLLQYRHMYIEKTNNYLFANPKTANKYLSCYHVVKKLAEKAKVSNINVFTSTRLRKQISTVLQALNLTETDMEQFSTFLGHTKKTHQDFYRLPQDVFQTAKVSKLLIAINSGKVSQFKESPDEIELSLEDTDDEEGMSFNIQPDSENIDHSDISKKNQKTSKREKNMKNVVPEKRENPKKIQRVRWNEEEKSVVETFFANHIKTKCVPKKKDFEIFKIEHENIFLEKGWVKIKTYVYNCFKK